MSAELPSTLELVDAPELAALHVLEVALSTAERALLAAYPELGEDSAFSAELATEAWLADAVLVHVTAIESALYRYRARLKSRGLLAAPEF